MSRSAPTPDVSRFLPPELASQVLELARGRGADFAELYAEYTVHTAFGLDEGRLKTASHSVLQGVGVRAIAGEQTGYAYADGFAPDDLREAARVAAGIARAGPSARAVVPFRVVEARAPFTLEHPAPLALDAPARIALLRRADDAARSRDGRVHEVSATFADSSKSLLVANSDGVWVEDRQYLSRLTVTALALEGELRQEGFASGGGRVEADYFELARSPETIAGEAAGTALTLLGAKEPEAGAYPVVVGPGWGGVMVHECFGHSMEGDSIRKKASIRATQRGQQVASKGVTIVDSGVVPYSRGSFRVDDEGTPAQRTVLVEDGVLVGYMWDLLNARLAGERPTGNGRRSSYREYPLCRMTNTFIESGPTAPDDLIGSVKRGLYCKNLGGGSVNPADGNFSFQVTEAWQIENGRLTHPVRNATLTGNGNDAMLKIDGVASDLRIDGTTGSCGKNGQWTPCGVGQPTVRFTEITVGGTQA
ncbi:MAG TPA: TldD/PmbA family protein [Candidatus Saccharimonadaceae bacterium]|jgi:TldD protein|nr:TldD/PmbA family protein [Candidatus Saccharimonadaceae bacterium]